MKRIALTLLISLTGLLVGCTSQSAKTQAAAPVAQPSASNTHNQPSVEEEAAAQGGKVITVLEVLPFNESHVREVQIQLEAQGVVYVRAIACVGELAPAGQASNCRPLKRGGRYVAVLMDKSDPDNYPTQAGECLRITGEGIYAIYFLDGQGQNVPLSALE